jgi:hypothetical protein
LACSGAASHRVAADGPPVGCRESARIAGAVRGRAWRRLHDGIANAPAYQLWLSAVGIQPQRNPSCETTYPWLGFRIGTIGKLKVDG